jgi:hypothetical protein
LKSTTRLYRRERYKYPISSNDFPTIDIKTDEIPSSHEAEMFSKRIHPNVVWELWVSNWDVTGHTLRETFAWEIAEYGSGVNEDVLAVFGVRGECWDSWRDGL